MHDSFPTHVKVYLCADHGVFIEQDGWDGCPVQVDYDGITCGRKDSFESYVKDIGY